MSEPIGPQRMGGEVKEKRGLPGLALFFMMLLGIFIGAFLLYFGLTYKFLTIPNLPKKSNKNSTTIVDEDGINVDSYLVKNVLSRMHENSVLGFADRTLYVKEETKAEDLGKYYIDLLLFKEAKKNVSDLVGNSNSITFDELINAKTNIFGLSSLVEVPDGSTLPDFCPKYIFDNNERAYKLSNESCKDDDSVTVLTLPVEAELEDGVLTIKEAVAFQKGDTIYKTTTEKEVTDEYKKADQFSIQLDYEKLNQFEYTFEEESGNYIFKSIKKVK